MALRRAVEFAERLYYNHPDMNPLAYLSELFETNHFTLYLALFLLACVLFRHLKLPPVPAGKLFVAAVVLGLALRVLWIGFSSYTPQTAWNEKHMLESDLTNVHAIQLTQGIWFHDEQSNPMARRPIGYPMLLGLLYKLFGPYPPVVYALNLTLFALSAWALFAIGKTVFSEQIAALAALLYAVYPVSVYSIKLVTDEHLFLPLWYGGLYLLLREIKGRPVRWPLLWYGLIFGYATMTRTHAIFMPVTVAFAYFLLKYPRRKIAAALVTTLLVMQAVNLPWVVRNYRVWGVPVLYTANDFFLYRTLNSFATPEGGGHIPQQGEEGYSAELEEAERSGNAGRHHQLCGQAIRRWIVGHPAQFLKLGACRVILFMAWNRAGGVWPLWFQFSEGSYDPARPVSVATKEALQETAFAFYYGLLFSFLFSLILIARRWGALPRSTRTSLLVMGSCFFFWLAEHMIIYPDRKYRSPLEPLMIVAACYFLDHLLRVYEPGRVLKRAAGLFTGRARAGQVGR